MESLGDSAIESEEEDYEVSDENYIDEDEGFWYQEINKNKIAGLLQGLLNNTRVNYLKIRSKSERGNLENIDVGIYKKLVELDSATAEDDEEDYYDDDDEDNDEDYIEDSSYQVISESKVAGRLSFFLKDFRMIYLRICSKSERGNLKKIAARNFKGLVELVELEVNNHKVKNIDKKAFEQNVNLMKINFSDNEITDLDPELFENLFQLREVDFQQNRLKDLPENLFEKNVDLLVINCAHNKIQKVPKMLLENLKHLQEIYLNHNRIKSISDRFFKKKNLRNIQLNNNAIKKIEVSKILRNIDFKYQLEINLSNNKLTFLRANTFKKMRAVKKIDLSNNAFKNLNSDTFSNTSIQTLDFSNNKIVEVPHDFPDVFQELILNGNKIRKIHDSLYKNKTNLRDLSLKGNQIDEIFMSEGKTGNVDKDENSTLMIDLGANNLKELKPFTFGSIKPRLELILSENSLKLLPAYLFVGSNVRSLNFANNLIEKLNPNIFENAWLNVSKADFSNNEIEILDEKLFDNWKSLEYLVFSHNQIKVLPEKLFDNIKSSMYEVSFADNEISKIGNHTFVNCKNLDSIDLKNNACFDISFALHSRVQHEVCSDNCEKSCFIVNEHDETYISQVDHPGIVYGRAVCNKTQTLVGNKCRYVRIKKLYNGKFDFVE